MEKQNVKNNCQARFPHHSTHNFCFYIFHIIIMQHNQRCARFWSQWVLFLSKYHICSLFVLFQMLVRAFQDNIINQDSDVKKEVCFKVYFWKISRWAHNRVRPHDKKKPLQFSMCWNISEKLQKQSVARVLYVRL